MGSYGIGAASGRRFGAAAPSAAGNGSGGAGTLTANAPGGNFSLASARGEVGDATAGKITLGIVNLTLIGVIAFYVWTRNSQGG